ncbi:MAG: AAA family ATPase [Planctomycetales bacterium]|nr:AAA family ATPase [Planctomycetales bacterium]NIM08669.1 AAA family ATPase [Planctomycetales bacterium]NIN08143.1 AAA family ATPase [Planctomycetales bacterium]NIN77270.1 AAA family ATPase [Planctomycetales bacterium]NIO34454.1 AAA family ATPase [Planctomycetales bacterium]
MSNVIRLAIVDPQDDTREELKSTLLGMDRVWLEAECSRYEFFSDVLAQTEPDIGIVSLDANPEKALALVEQLNNTAPQCSVLVTSSSTDGDLILRAMRAGAKEFLTQPVGLNDMLQALERIGDRYATRGDLKPRGNKIIAVAGATGGVGSTSIAVNLGCALAESERNSVVLVDLDLCLGDADVCLDAIPDFTLLDVAQNTSRMDITLLKRSLTKHSSGLYLLPRPVQLDDVDEITPDDLHRLVGLLKATFTHIILDLSKSFGPLDRLALELADDVLLVTQLDLPCLRNVVRLMMSFNENERLSEKIKVVVNRTGLDQNQIGIKKAQDTIGREIFWKVSNDFRTMVEARNNGVPLIEQSRKQPITQQIIELAAALDGDATAGEEEDEDAAAKSGIGRWFSFKK